MTIGQLARQGGVNVETIRYYQRRGLLPVPPQSASAPSEGRVRRYDEAVLRRLRFIKSAQAAGFTLTEIAELLELDASSDRARARELADAHDICLIGLNHEAVLEQVRINSREEPAT